MYEQLAIEILHHSTLAVVLHEGVVLLGCTLCQGLEPVCIMGGPHLLSPFLHAFCHGICDRAVETGAILHHVDHFSIHLRREVLEHFLTVENVLSEVLGGSLIRCWHLKGLLLKGLFYDLKSKLVTHYFMVCLKFANV